MSDNDVSTNKWTERRFGNSDPDYHIRARLVTEVIVEYEVREIGGFKADGTLLFACNEDNGCGDDGGCGVTESIDDSDVFVKGNVKWDGCSDNQFTPYYHACSRYSMTRIGEIFGHVFDMAADLMPGHDEYLR